MFLLHPFGLETVSEGFLHPLPLTRNLLELFYGHLGFPIQGHPHQLCGLLTRPTIQGLLRLHMGYEMHECLFGVIP